MKHLFKTIYQDKRTINLNYKEQYLYNDCGIVVSKQITNKNTEDYIVVKNKFKEDTIKYCTQFQVKNLKYKNINNYDFVVEYRLAYDPILSLNVIKDSKSTIVKKIQEKLVDKEHIDIDIITMATKDDWYRDYIKKYNLLNNGERSEYDEGDAITATLEYIRRGVVNTFFYASKNGAINKISNNSFRNCTEFTKEKFKDYCFDTTIRVKIKVEDRNKANELIDIISDNFKEISGDNFLIPKQYSKGILLTHLITEKDRDKMIKDKRSTAFWKGNNILSSKELVSLLRVLDIN